MDPEERLRFKTLVEEIKKDRCVIISTHIVEDVEATCDRIVVLSDRKIVGSGTIDTIREIARDKVYDILETELPRVTGRYFIFKKYERDHHVRYRFLSDEPQVWPAVNPHIEDGYLCLVKNY